MKDKENLYIDKAINKFNDNDFKGAIKELNKVIEINPQNDVAYYKRGKTKRKLEDFAGAINDYNKVLEINPDDKAAKISIQIIQSILNRKNLDIYANTNTDEIDMNI